jgi:hypothetical protein
MTSREDAYLALVSAPAAGEPCAASGLLRIEPGNPEGSLLWQKVASRSPICGDPMPISAMLPDERIEQLRGWIERGAPND